MTRARAYEYRLAGVLAGMLLFLSCDSGGFVKPDPNGTSTPVSIRIDSLPATLARDDTVAIHATVLDENGDPLSVSTIDWSTSDTKVATVQPVSSSGALLTGQDQGTATITASYDQLSASKTVKVHRRPTDLVYVSGSGQTGTTGTQLPDSLVVRAVDRRGDPVSDVSISFVVTAGGGSVSPTGGLTDAGGRLSSAWTLGSGLTQQVQARASEAQQRVQQLKDSVVVYTATTDAAVVGLAVLPDSPTVDVGDSLQFEAMATTSDGAQMNDGQVAWTTTDTTVARISSKGLLHGRKAGQTGVVARTTQTATGNAMADTTQVTVASTASTSGTLLISSPDTLYGIGSTQTLTVQARAADGSSIANPDVQWSSLNPQVATVDSVGKVTAQALGTALITAASLCCSPDTVGVVVADSTAATTGTVTIIVPDTLRGIGDTLTLTVDAKAADGTPITNPDVQWSSLNPDIATVDTMGKVTSKALGTAIITAATLCCSTGKGVVTVAAGDPGAVTDLASASVATDSVTIRWTQVDDGTGHPAKYAIRDGSPTLSWGSASATEVSVDGTGVGKTATYTYAGLTPGTNYQFQLISYRGTLNSDAVFGPLSNTASATTDTTVAGTPGPVANVVASPSSYRFSSLGQTAQITATATDSAGLPIDTATLAFSSNDPSTVSVDTMGRMTANALGTALITVTAVCCNASAAVNASVDTTTSTVTLVGSGFGTKANVAPRYFNTFDDDTLGTPSDAIGFDEHDSGEGPPAYVENDWSRSGSKSLKMVYPQAPNDQGGTYPKIGLSLNGGLDLYMAFWVRYDRDNLTVLRVDNLKTTRIGSGQLYYGIPQLNMSLFPTANGGNITAGDSYYEDGVTTHKDQNYTPNITINKDHFVEVRYRLSTPGVADGFALWKLDGHLYLNSPNAATRASGITAQLAWVVPFFNGVSNNDETPYQLWIDDLIVDTTFARVIATDAPIYANSTNWAPQDPTTWSDTKITIDKPNWSTFAPGSTVYFHVFDANDKWVAAFAQTVP